MPCHRLEAVFLVYRGSKNIKRDRGAGGALAVSYSYKGRFAGMGLPLSFIK